MLVACMSLKLQQRFEFSFIVAWGTISTDHRSNPVYKPVPNLLSTVMVICEKEMCERSVWSCTHRPNDFSIGKAPNQPINLKT